MDWKRLAPWNWFKDEDDTVPANLRRGSSEKIPDSLPSVRAEFERLFEEASRPLFAGRPNLAQGFPHTSTPIRPRVDISEGRKAYTVRAELPGVERDDMSLEIDGHTLVIRAEKHEDREEDDEGYHWIERSHGSVQRVLSLPENADVESIDARFKNGVLKLRIPKHASLPVHGRNIEIQSG